MGITLLVRPVDQQRRQLALRFYPKWYCAMSGVDQLARILSLASNKYIVHENANVKAFSIKKLKVMIYLRKLMNNILILKFFAIMF